MMTRLVKMQFRHDAVEDFKAIFEKAQPLISAFPGCEGVRLVQDILHPHIFFTISIWRSHEDLEHYRESELFLSTWAKTKVLFDAKPEAWSVHDVA